MPQLTADGISLSYEDTGGDARPVVLIHGWPLSGASWSEQVPALTAAGHRVITYDRRGSGDSDKPDSGYDYDTFAADLAGLLEELDLRDVALVGFSMSGGEIARDDREGFLDGFTTDFFSAGGELEITEEQRQQALTLAAKAGDQGLVECINAFGTTDFRADLEKVTVPTLVIHGDGDATVPFEVSGKRTAEIVDGAELVVVKDGPHGLNVSHAEEFDRALLAFLG